MTARECRLPLQNIIHLNGTCIHGIGIEPDVEVDMPDEYKDMYASMVEHDKDTQLQKAIEIIKEK